MFFKTMDFQSKLTILNFSIECFVRPVLFTLIETRTANSLSIIIWIYLFMCFDLSFFIKRQFGIRVRWVGEWVCEWESLGRVSGVGGSGSSQIFFCVESLGRVFGPSCTRQTMKFAILMMLIEQMCWRSRNWGASRLLLENLFIQSST